VVKNLEGSDSVRNLIIIIFQTANSRNREWVAHNAVKYVTQSFETLKEARMAAFTAEIQAIPYYDLYYEHRGRPPIPAQLVNGVEQRIATAEMELHYKIDNDWRNCVLKYPEVLAHYFSLVNLTLPKQVEAPASIIPTSPAYLPTLPASKGRSMSGGSQKKARRVSLTMAAPPEVDEQAIEAMTKIFSGQKLSGHKARGGPTSPLFDYPTKLPAKKRITPQQEYALSGKRGHLRAPTAPPSAGGPWRAPPQF
jgi:hypothetical protein